MEPSCLSVGQKLYIIQKSSSNIEYRISEITEIRPWGNYNLVILDKPIINTISRLMQNWHLFAIGQDFNIPQKFIINSDCAIFYFFKEEDFVSYLEKFLKENVSEGS